MHAPFSFAFLFSFACFITSVLLLCLPGYLGAPGGDASAFPFPNDAHPQSKLHEERVGGVSKAGCNETLTLEQ